MRPLSQPKREDLELAAVLHALGDPVRLDLLRRMDRDGECMCSPAGVNVPRSTLSNHWRILREAGITSTVAVGKERRMTLRRDDLDARFPGLLDAVLGQGTRATAPSQPPPTPKTAPGSR
ncbi:ArsR/SmtB family transcription factor [Micromonospora sp. URMC 106]|uniref:ArsR/SmtB family transcription factor n=1 Tax=Micromonospora sp. URMC 106 TaxID=3423408 RepID=UPI003F1C67AB